MSSIRVGNGQMNKNIIMNLSAFLLQLIINLYISPIIVANVNTSAYGFMNMANDFVSYASIITSIFNSVAARFIANEFYHNNYENANKYFNSLLLTNIILSIVLGSIGFVITSMLEAVLNIPSSIIIDVKITFALIFLSYIISLLTMVYTTATFVTNRTDIQGVRNIINYVIRFSCILLFINFISIKIYWVAFSTLLGNIVISLVNIRLTKKLTPELRVNLKTANIKYVKILAASGIWMSITSISAILMRGLDLIIANKLLDSNLMGILSLARTMPNNVTSVINTIAPLFTPVFIMLYSKQEKNKLTAAVVSSIHNISAIMYVPIAGFIVLANDFYGIWQNSLGKEELALVVILSNITVLQAFFNSSTATLAQISVVTNKLKIPVLVSLGSGILNVIIVILFIEYSPLGIYSIVIISSVIMILRYIVFTPIYASYCLGLPVKIFYKDLLKIWILIPILIISMNLVHINFKAVTKWSELGIEIILCGIIGYVETVCILYYKKVISWLKKKK